tara:strand:+ start:2224 stop:2475 length:252 start_codon:yes stop_codon:yes gene_type:complete
MYYFKNGRNLPTFATLRVDYEIAAGEITNDITYNVDYTLQGENKPMINVSVALLQYLILISVLTSIVVLVRELYAWYSGECHG